VKEGPYGGQPDIAAPRFVTSLFLQVVQELAYYRRTYVLEHKIGRLLVESLLKEPEQHPKGVAV
jgi:hypothetical protein